MTRPICSLTRPSPCLPQLLLTLLLLCLALTLHRPAIAAGAVDHTIRVSTSFDRQTPAGPLILWNDEKGGTNPIPGVRARDSWLCHSSSDPKNGACPTSPIWGDDYSLLNWLTTPIQLTFTEKRSRVSTTLTLIGSIRLYADPPSPCSPSVPRVMHQATIRGCYAHNVTRIYNGAELSVSLPAAEYAKIPSGGIWEARLILRQRQWYPDKDVASWTANITLDVTDRNNGAIYLPAFGKANALVDLNLRTKPLSTAPGGEVSGNTVIDTCLYDGYNANNAWLQVTLSDLLPANGRAADVFSIAKTGTTGAAVRDRVDYRITMDYNGKPIAMENRKTQILNGVNTASIRPVVLPGINVPVVCTPTPLTLTVQPFAKASKTAGRYSGTLRINLAARTLAP